MADFLTPADRSVRMSRVRGKDTLPEVRLRRALHQLGLRYRMNVGDLPGRPDLVFPRHRAVVFVHGCYWHRHEGCKAASTPATNVDFWQAKFTRNIERDRQATRLLEASGWRVLVAWECEFRSEFRLKGFAKELADQIRRTGGRSGITVDRPSPGCDAPSSPLKA